MGETRYFIFNHKKAFAQCRIDGGVWADSCVCAENSESFLIKTPALDSGSKDNAWQRVAADITLYEGAKIVWRLYASNNATAIFKEAAYVIENTNDFIPVGVCGRYAVLEAEAYGRVEIHSIRVYSAWESFLDYLPEIYRDYNGFADRFLKLLAVSYLDLERKISETTGTFNPDAADEKMLRWLSEIVGVPHIGIWSTEGLRKLLISGIYKRRGQFDALENYILYFTGFRPFVAESFRYMTGRYENDQLYKGCDVTIFLPPESAEGGYDDDALEFALSDFLPADLVWRVVTLNPYLAVSDYAYVGINTRIGGYDGVVVGKSRIGFAGMGDKR